MKTVCILTLFLFFGKVYSNIDSKLYYYETLSRLDEVKREKRSVDGIIRNTNRHVQFNAFGRSFKLILENNADVLSPDFKATLVRKDGSSTRVNVNKNELFQGHLAGERYSLIDAHIEDGVWTANIYTKHESYHIEPSWRHLPQSSRYFHLVYRGSDIKHNITFPHKKQKKLCDGIKVDVDPKDIIYDNNNNNKYGGDRSNRTKRQNWLSGATSCQLYVSADHLFHHGIGGGQPHTTVNYLINTFQAVNNIFRKTLWEEQSNLIGVGFQLKELKIHEKSTKVGKGELHYNMAKTSQWLTRDLLEVFSRQSTHKNFCLAHLFTYQKFSGGVLGLAYIASPRQRTVGGICSPSYTKNKIKLTLNSGWSSSMNTNGDRLLTQEANLVTTHELGHNWGSEHDVETDECAPSSITGRGKYIMYPYAVKGYDDNNRKFSPCSWRWVSDVLKAKAYNCFTAQVVNTPYCGNGIVDTTEECDGGKTGIDGGDPCCSPDCKLIGNSMCSPMNYECCVACQMASEGVICREAFRGGCYETAKCSGYSLDCPPSEPVSNTTSCLEGGTCYDGECISFCKLDNGEPCRCENNEHDACHRCCRGTDGKCKRFGDTKLPKGRACYLGFCSDDGRCMKSDQDMVQRLFSFIEKLTPNAFVEFMKRNIVGTIMIFSMVIWIPASWTYSCIDKKREEKDRYISEWKSYKSNDFLQHSLDSTRSIKLLNSNKNRVSRHTATIRQPMYVNRPAPKFHRDKPSEIITLYNPQQTPDPSPSSDIKKSPENIQQSSYERHPGTYNNERHPGTYNNERHPGTNDNERHPGTYNNERHPGTNDNETHPGTYNNETHPGTNDNKIHLDMYDDETSPSSTPRKPNMSETAV